MNNEMLIMPFFSKPDKQADLVQLSLVNNEGLDEETLHGEENLSPSGRNWEGALPAEQIRSVSSFLISE